MGAATILSYAEGPNLDSTFEQEVEDAREEFGDDGYTGSLAEKDEVFVLEADPMPYDHAVTLAHRLLAGNDPRIDDKWGPVGAIAVQGGERTVRIEVETSHLLRTGDEQMQYAEELVAQRFPGATVQSGPWFSIARENGLTRGTVTMVIRGAAEHTGWLFVGWAST